MKVVLLNQVPEVNNKYSFSLARGLIRSGVDVKVCGIETDDVSDYRNVPFLPLFHSYSEKRSLFSKVISYRDSWIQVLDYCVNNKINIVHVQWYIFSPLDYYYHKKLQKNGIRIVSTIHDLLPFNKKFYDYHYHKKIYRNADSIISQAENNRTHLVDEYGVKDNKINYIPHGHYMDFAEPVTKADSRNYLGIEEDRQVVLFFGQIKKVKGVDILIKAMRAVADSHPNVLCIIAGKVWKDDFSVYSSLIKELKLTNNFRNDIKFIPDEEIKYYFNASDIVALPYRQIYQSGVVLLAYAYEKPVVATNTGEFTNVIIHNKTGLLVKVDDTDSLSEALNWYLDNPEKAQKYAADGKKYIMDKLSWEKISSSIIDIYGCVSGE